MAVTILKSQQLGDMQARYLMDEQTRNVELQLLPMEKQPVEWTEKQQAVDSLVQVKIEGDAYSGGYAGGGTLRGGETTLRMKYASQRVEALPDGGTEIVTMLRDDRGLCAAHHLRWPGGTRTLWSRTEFFNESAAPVSLELLSSFSLGGLTPFTPGDAHETLIIHRARSAWSAEGRLESRTAEELGLEPAWVFGNGVRCERFGQVGSLPVNHWFPWLLVEDTANHVFWGAQTANNGSWQMELYRRDDGLAISGGLADREFGQWVKTVQPGGRFTTPESILTVCADCTLDEAAQRLVSAAEPAVDAGPASEQDLPVMFNEYCTTWGCPSEENIRGILKAIRGKGLAYFVIDAGWYKEDGVSWDESMGDYQPSATLFPHGLEATVQAIREAGLVPGLWFEIDNVGTASHAYRNEEHLLHRDGRVLTNASRRFWNMSDPWVQNYLREHVTGLLKRYGFGYIKMDYNDSIGPGCDGCESLGEGLRRDRAASLAFIESMKREIPGLIVENCASGGHKLEPSMLGATAMSSFSDAHECPEIPILAANLQRLMLPRQSQIWAVIRKTDSQKRIAYSLTNTFLGRMCFSGDVTELSAAQWNLIEQGIAFYRKAAPILKHGISYRYGPAVASYRHARGWQGVLRVQKGGDAFLTLHVFAAPYPETVSIPLPAGEHYRIGTVYAACDAKPEICGNNLVCTPAEPWSSLAVYLERC